MGICLFIQVILTDKILNYLLKSRLNTSRSAELNTRRSTRLSSTPSARPSTSRSARPATRPSTRRCVTRRPRPPQTPTAPPAPPSSPPPPPTRTAAPPRPRSRHRSARSQGTFLLPATKQLPRAKNSYELHCCRMSTGPPRPPLSPAGRCRSSRRRRSAPRCRGRSASRCRGRCRSRCPSRCASRSPSRCPRRFADKRRGRSATTFPDRSILQTEHQNGIFKIKLLNFTLCPYSSINSFKMTKSQECHVQCPVY